MGVFFSVADMVGGPNLVSRPVLEAATAALAGMVEAKRRPAPPQRPAIAVTAFGNTQAAVAAVHALLGERGREAVAFHASGAGGSAMEELIEAGFFDGVIDLTTHELAGEICSQDVYAPTRSERLTAAARRGLPQVVAPGGLDYFCFGAAETILSANIFGGMCARVCPTETLCEEACVRELAEGKPVRIGELQRYATDALMAEGRQPFARARA